MKNSIYCSIFLAIVPIGFLFFSDLKRGESNADQEKNSFINWQKRSILGSCPTNYIAFTNIPPIIDGVVDVCWTGAEIGSFTHTTVGTEQTDFSGSRWRALYDNTYLYVIAEIKDDVLKNDGGTDWYNDDCLEVFIDGRYNRGTSYDNNDDFQYAFRYNDPTIVVGTNSVKSSAGMSFAQHLSADGYNIEIRIPWTTINISPPINGQTIGFDIEVDDDDGIGNNDREAQVAAFDISGNAWQNPNLFGMLTTCSGIPDLAIDKAIGQTDSTNSTTINFTVTFSEPVIGFVRDDVHLSGSAGAINKIVSGTGSEYNVAVSGMTGEGEVIINIDAGVCTDYTANLSAAPTIVDNIVYYDITRPAVEITLENSQLNPTNSPTISFNATFSEPVKNFKNTSVQLSTTTGASTVYVRNGPQNFIIDISGMTVPGDVTITIPENTVNDPADNLNIPSTNTENTVYFDNVKPDVEISTTETSPTSLTSIPILIEFSKSVAGFDVSDINISNGSISDLTNTNLGFTWTANIIPLAPGNINIQIPADAAVDEVGNSNNASNHFMINYIGENTGTFSAYNIFTPNSTLNRFWIINNVDNYTEYELIIRNSSGQIVYKTTNYKNDWNGTYKNKALPTGTYYYFFSSPDKQTIYKGFINIIYE
jgi:gliding motility-associated-like protein